MNKIIVFKEKMLHASERFVLDQATHIKKYEVILAGMNKLPFIDIDCLPSFFIDQISKIQVLSYKLFGICPVLIHTIKQINPILIHIHMGGDGARFSRLKGIKPPFIVTFHGTDASTSDTWKKKSKLLYYRQYISYRETLKDKASYYIAVSKYVKNKMIDQGFPSDKIAVHYIGVDTGFFTPSKCIRKKSVLFVGRLTELKGCHLLIAAMKIVQGVIPEAVLNIIGNGNDWELLHDLSVQSGVHATFLGTLDRIGIKKHLNESAVFCVPSITAESGGAEGFGIVFLEAQSMGVPVVSFSSGGIPEAVLDKKTGFLYPEKDINSIAQGIITLLNDKVLWETFSVNAMRHVRENFNIKNQTQKLELIYQEVEERFS